ncbi:Stk1 family PASTA domain-containing Ser/Thr kinase [Tessaracoccus rhinocerotis]|uniref:non-specific serine/threonine protein kinase n=1 Tax=Tessaracoccus rhinocerotis TaxID=1689449 RepID=A0A553JZ84_9ACTN|nr:Stk1 family PASTA domain-containing Ser/Thr kinase [Tessaracoccus rhinocerotis]TRY17737.1 Stk1 family PASTA domain-containing Ser/Thr kinase [Tessaracoccus rhinocerotis]
MTERGTVLQGRYELDQIIGRGGMAEVWRARDRRLVRDVAVKRLRVDLASDPTFQARFRREAQSAAGLNHPNIVAVYDTGEELDTASDVSVPYIVMELVEGVTLRDVLRDGRKVLPERALEFTKGVLDALAYSHRAGIIHRDIKPANVMLTPSGSVKVMDFGIARAVADTSATMTQTAAVIGTAQYLSPEQARGEKVDNRSDIYAVGCLLYELLVSQPPFKGDSPVSVAYQHVREIPVPPSQLDSEITPDMDAIVMKSLAKAPGDRYQDAREMAADVTRAINGEPVHALLAPVGAEQPTAVQGYHANAPTHVAQRAAVASAPSPVYSPGELDEDEEEPRSKKGIIILASLAGLVVVGMIIALAMLLNPGTPEPEMVTVPSVVGASEVFAVGQVEAAELVPKVEYEAGSEDNQGEVVRQSPEGDAEAEVGSEVVLVVSTGVELFTVPDNLVGMPRADALRVLDDAGFSNVTVRDADPANRQEEPVDAEAGTVTVVNPAEGAEIPADGELELVIATGRSPIPDLTGRTLEVAMDEAKDAGFTEQFEVVYEQTDQVAPGNVFDQTPAAGESHPRNTVINVKVAEAVDTTLPVPELVALTLEAAQQAATDAGFTSPLSVTEEQTDEAEPGTIVSQAPAAGERIEPNVPIEVVVAVGPQLSEMPNLLGLSQEQAGTSLDRAGFTNYRFEDEVTPGAPADTVLEQNIAAGEQVDPETEVVVIMARAPGNSNPNPSDTPS